MNCTIIYYSARKTSFCEKALKKCFPEMGLTLDTAVFATQKRGLGDALIGAFAKTDVVFTVGGLEFGDSRAICEIVSQAAAGSEPTLCRRLKNDSGDDGYLIRAGKQLLVMLPDEPEQLAQMTRGALTAYIRSM